MWTWVLRNGLYCISLILGLLASKLDLPMSTPRVLCHTAALTKTNGLLLTVPLNKVQLLNLASKPLHPITQHLQQWAPMP
jgi:hypothetical protein